MNEAPLRHDRKFQMRMDDEFDEKLLDLRKSEADLPQRAEMLRRLVDRAHLRLKSRGK